MDPRWSGRRHSRRSRGARAEGCELSSRRCRPVEVLLRPRARVAAIAVRRGYHAALAARSDAGKLPRLIAVVATDSGDVLDVLGIGRTLVEGAGIEGPRQFLHAFDARAIAGQGTNGFGKSNDIPSSNVDT